MQRARILRAFQFDLVHASDSQEVPTEETGSEKHSARVSVCAKSAGQWKIFAIIEHTTSIIFCVDEVTTTDASPAALKTVFVGDYPKLFPPGKIGSPPRLENTHQSASPYARAPHRFKPTKKVKQRGTQSFRFNNTTTPDQRTNCEIGQRLSYFQKTCAPPFAPPP